MKQKSFWHIAKVLTRNIARLFWVIICHFALEIQFRIKWFLQDLSAFRNGFTSHRNEMQSKLRHNHRIYKDMKQFEGYYINGEIHKWEDAALF